MLLFHFYSLDSSSHFPYYVEELQQYFVMRSWNSFRNLDMKKKLDIVNINSMNLWYHFSVEIRLPLLINIHYNNKTNQKSRNALNSN